MGWDAIDEFKANVRGWQTQTLPGLPYRHHRREGERDGARIKFWSTEGSAAFFMGYRPSYLILRSFFRALREPAALAMITGYAGAAIRREDRLGDGAPSSICGHSSGSGRCGSAAARFTASD